MDEQTDLATIVDMNHLKAMVFDRSEAMQVLQNEIQMIRERIAQLSAAPVTNGKVPSKT